ncbi:MAG: PKD domain-containing protein [Methanoregula sp.]|nr:MAG: PKD domain-containing protein [Methanoregula sp.]
MTIRQTPDGYIFTGFTSSTNDEYATLNHGSYDLWVVKLDTTGEMQWQDVLGGSGDEWGMSVRQTLDNGYIVTGYTNSNDIENINSNNGGTDAWVLKLGSSGNIEWQKLFGGENYDAGHSIIQTSDWGYVFAGYTDSSNSGDVGKNHGYFDIWVVKLDGSGEILWKKLLGGNGSEITYFGNGIQQTTDGGFILLGYTTSNNNGDVGHNHGGTDLWVAKLSNAGELQWEKTLGGASNELSGSIEQISDGGYILTGNTLSSNTGDVGQNNGDTDYWVVKLDSIGVIQWQDTLGGNNLEQGNCVKQTSDGGYIITGFSRSANSGDIGENHGFEDAWTIKLRPRTMTAPEDVKRYAPNLWFEDSENYYPINPFFYVNDFDKINGENGKNSYLAMTKDQKINNITVLYHVDERIPDTKVYEYWFYYPFNDFLDQHYHDWETVFVFVDKTSGSVKKVVASSHSDWDPNNVLDNPGKDHSDILVECGSHASVIDGNNNGRAGYFEPFEISNPYKYVIRSPNPVPEIMPWAYQIWGFGNLNLPRWLVLEYPILPDTPPDPTTWWKPGIKIANNDPRYKLKEISPTFIHNFDGQEKLPNSPFLGSFNLKVPQLGIDSYVPIGGNQPLFAWNTVSWDNPEKIDTPLEYVMQGAVTYLHYSPHWYEYPGSVIVIFSDQQYVTATNASGFFLINNVTPGYHEVVVNRPGFSPYKQRFLNEGNSSLGADEKLYLVPESDSFRIQGYVRNQDGSILSNYPVDVYDGNNTHLFTTLTEEDGSYLETVSKWYNYTVVVADQSSNGTVKVNSIAGSVVWANITIGTHCSWPIPNFTASSTNISTFETVQFTDTSEASPTKWYWEFGDGTNSTEQNPSHMYLVIGNYTVNLTAWNDLGSDTETKTDYITVGYQKPINADFNATPTTGSYPLTVRFTDLTSSSPNKWYWEFGDGTNSTVRNPVHIYQTGGNFTVNLTASNIYGNDTVTKEDYIRIYPTPVPVAGFTSNYSYDENKAPVTVRFVDQSVVSGNETRWFWDFGDGTNSTEQNPVHSFDVWLGYYYGGYQISLTVTDNYGRTSTFSEYFVEVRKDYELDFIGEPRSGKSPLNVTFSDTSPDDLDPRYYLWDFGDGTSFEWILWDNPEEPPKNITHVYSAPGNYTVTLTKGIVVLETEVTKTRVDYIIVTSPVPPVANFSANITSGKVPLAVAFSDLSSGSPTGWSWTFGDGAGSLDRNPVHVYSSAGIYTVSLHVTNADGSDTATKVNYVSVSSPVPPVADFSANTTSGTAPLAVAFTDTSSGSPTSWSWNFGDGITTTDRNPVHVYSATGKYTVSLSVTNADGSDTITKPDYITVTSPTPTPTPTPTPGTIPATIRIEPETLNLKSKGVFTAFITLPSGYNVNNIDVASLVCEGAHAKSGHATGGGEYIAKFERQDLVGIVPGDAVTFTVVGNVIVNGNPIEFRGSDTIRVIE